MAEPSVNWTLADALGIQELDLVALVGGGGKSSLMFSLVEEWRGSVATTTTRIFKEQMKKAPAVCVLENNAVISVEEGNYITDALKNHRICLIIGALDGDKALGVSPALPQQILSRKDVTLVVVEADGSRMKPCKAPADHEPVFPTGTNVVVPVIGMDAVGRRIDQVCHRPELVSQILGKSQSETLTASDLATLLIHPRGGLKDIPEEAKVIPFINKVETGERMVVARALAQETLLENRISRVVLGAMKRHSPVVEVHRRVTAVVLAAGESIRMGDLKLLLPWGRTTVLGATLDNLKSSSLHDIILVTGHEADKVKQVGREAAVTTIYNPDFVGGEMLSSLQIAIRSLSQNREAILVVLADQPMVSSQTIDEILTAYWQGSGELIAPSFQGQRGNPVLIGRHFFPELLDLPRGGAPRDLLRTHLDKLHQVTVSDPSVLYDLDTPEDYYRWRPVD